MSHLLDKFHYCPACGSPHFEENDFKSKRCADCGFTYYMNAAAAVVCFIVNEREQLLVATRGEEPAKGTLDLPGGFVDMNETVEEGMIREIHEETGLQVAQVDYLFSIPNLYMYSGMDIHTIDMFYEVHVGSNTEVTARDDAAEAMWLPVNKINPADFGLRSIRQAVERFIEDR
jgi:NADH pyrophosphatase NudC (nudix superfamily)